MTESDAETLAIRAMGWIAGEGGLLDVFLGSTGAAPDSLREALENREFLAAVLDFLLMDDGWVLGCAAALGVPPERFVAARMQLPGGLQPNWT